MVVYIRGYILGEIMGHPHSLVSMSIGHVLCYLLHILYIFHMVKAYMGLLVVWERYMLGMGCQYNLVDRYIPRGRQSLNNQRFVHMDLVYRVGVQLVVVYIRLEEVD